MNIKASLAAAALLLALGACGDNQAPNQPRTLAPPAATPPPAADAAPFESDPLPPECDFADRDTTRMNESEHQQMLDDCEAAQRQGNTTTTPGSRPPR